MSIWGRPKRRCSGGPASPSEVTCRHDGIATSSPMTTTAQLSYPEADRTPPSLRLGMLAGPLYVLVGLLEVLFRSGFDIRRHALSLTEQGLELDPDRAASSAPESW